MQNMKNISQDLFFGSWEHLLTLFLHNKKEADVLLPLSLAASAHSNDE